MEQNVRYCTTSDGVRIAYSVHGDGPPLLCVSTIWASHLTVALEGGMGRAIEALSERLTVVRFDGRGSGLSDRDAVDFSLEARIRDIDGVVERLGLARFAILAVGHAAPAAVAYAAANPDRVSDLVLASTWVSGRDAYRDSEILRFASSLTSVTQEQWEHIPQTIAVRMLGTDDPRLHSVVHLIESSLGPDAFLSFRDINRQLDVTDLLPHVQAPTLVIHREPGIFPLKYAQQIVAAVPNATMTTTPGEGFLGLYDVEIDRVLSFLGCDPVMLSPVGEAPRTPDTAFRAVLFTDLVGHTDMMSRLGDERGRDVLREHERITREVLKANGGTEVKTMGDGFMASFSSVTKAVECAVALQRAFADRNAGVRTRPPDVGARRPFSRDDATSDIDAPSSEPDFANRNASPQTPPSTSNATPSPEHPEPLSVRVGLNVGEPIEEDGDLFGATVILASRIAAKADGGEILVADTVRGLCSGKGFLFADRGDFVAKGFEEPVRVYEVSWRS